MDILEKLSVLADAAKYDVACTSSGSERQSEAGKIGNTIKAGICHSFAADGRCISLLKVLLTNYCIYDCKYCVNRHSNDVKRAMFTPAELGELTINFYKRNYIEGLFLSSAVIKSADYTMELLFKTLQIIRNEYKFNGYIHVKAIPGADSSLVLACGALADRMSVNIELPSSESLTKLAPDKTKNSVLKPMRLIKNQITETKNNLVLYKKAPNFVPAGQSTQMIVGATPETDKKIMTLSENLYKQYSLRRVFYSAYVPVMTDPFLPILSSPPLIREHRLYQADWLLRFYHFKADELFSGQEENFDLFVDPKCAWALQNYHLFPIEITTADYYLLMRIPGIGQTSAQKIIKARRTTCLGFDDLKKMGISVKRAQYFITVSGKMYGQYISNTTTVYHALKDNNRLSQFEQLSLFDYKNNLLPDHSKLILPAPTQADYQKSLFGQV